MPFLHFFDGFRTSHEVAKVEQLDADDLRAMIDDDLVARPPRPRALAGSSRASAARRRTPTFTSRRARPCNPYYLAAPTIVQNAMDKFAELAGRQYHLFDYVGAPDAERVIVMMGSGAEVAQRPSEALIGARREGRRAEGAAVPAVLGRSVRGGPARDA